MRHRLLPLLVLCSLAAASLAVAAPPPGSNGRLDADTLDGLDSAQFLRSDASGRLEGSLALDATGLPAGIFALDVQGRGASLLRLQGGAGEGAGVALGSPGSPQWHLGAGAGELWNAGLFGLGTGDGRGSTKLVVTPQGDVGVGTTARPDGDRLPAARLDVAGTLRVADGTEAAGRVLTSDAHGVAHWADPASPAGAVQVERVRLPDRGDVLPCDNEWHAFAGRSATATGPARLDVTSSTNAVLHSQTDVALRIDGVVDLDSVDVYALTGRATFHSAAVADVGPGAHAIELLYRCWSGGTVDIDNHGQIVVRTLPL